MIIVMTPEEWQKILRSQTLRHHIRFMNPNQEPERQVASLMLHLIAAAIGLEGRLDAQVVVDYGPGSGRPGLREPEVPTVLLSRRLASEAQRKALRHAHAERLAAAGMRTLAFAWREREPFPGYRLEVMTEDGQSRTMNPLSEEIMALGHDVEREALTYATQMGWRELQAFADKLIREELGYPVHLGRL